MRSSLVNIRIGKSMMCDTVYAGFVDSTGQGWRIKKDVTQDFLSCVLERWNGYSEIITSPDGKRYKVQVEELPQEEKLADIKQIKQEVLQNDNIRN